MCEDAGKTNQLLFITKNSYFYVVKVCIRYFVPCFVMMSFCEYSGVIEAQGSCHILDNLSRSLYMCECAFSFV